MIKFLTFILMTVCFIAKGQEPFFKYKQVADKLVRQEFDSSIARRTKCEEFYVDYSDGTFDSYPSYEEFKFETDKVLTITFTYSFFSNVINNRFQFNIQLNTRKQFINKRTVTDSTPMCIKTNSSCNFILKDSAIQVAITDSIKYNDNLKVGFARAPNQQDYYWIIKGQPKQNLREQSKHKYRSSYGDPSTEKYVNATTGQLVNESYFYKDLH